MLEDALREMLAAKVEKPPAVDDPAGAAIDRGRRVRRRRAALSSVAAAVVLVVALTGAVSLQSRWLPGRGAPSVGLDADQATPAPSGAPTPTAVAGTGLRVDLRSGDRLWTAGGRLLTLAGAAPTARVQRVPAGWVYEGVDRVRLLRQDGASIGLSGQGDRWLLSPDGTRIAFVIDTALHVGRVGVGGLAIAASVDVPDGSTPAAFVDDRVLLATGAGDARRFAVVDPARPTAPVFSAAIAAVYGAEGGTLTALVRSAGSTCLATVDPDGWRRVRTGGCTLGLSAGDGAQLAPGGDWLARRTADGLTLVPVARVLAGQAAPAVTCRAAGRGAFVWADGSTALVAEGDAVVRCGTDGSRRTVRLPDGLDAGWQFAPAPGRAAAS